MEAESECKNGRLEETRRIQGDSESYEDKSPETLGHQLVASEFTAEQLREKPGVTVAEWSPTAIASKPGIRIKLKLINFS